MGFVKNTKSVDIGKSLKDFTKESDAHKSIRNAKPKSDGGDIDISSYNSAIKAAEESDDPDAYKYKLAVEIVDSEMGNEQTLGDDAYREAIDRTFDQMDPTISGAEMRGEDDPFSGAVRTARGAIDTVNNLAGHGIDTLWDLTAGNAAGLIGGGLGAIFDGADFGEAFDNAKQSVGDMVTPETGSIASDMLIDLGLSAIPGVGIPLAVGKNAIQQSENIFEGLTGVDDITGEEIDPGQQAAKLGIGVGSTLFSALPGLGKAKNVDDIAKAGAKQADDITKQIASLTSKEAGKGAAKEVAEEAGESAAKKVAGEAAEEVGENAAKGAGKAVENVVSAADDAETLEALTAMLDDANNFARANKPIAALDNALDSLRGYPGNFKTFMAESGKSFRDAPAQFASKHPIKGLQDIASGIGNAKRAVLPPVSRADALAKMTAGAKNTGRLGNMVASTAVPVATSVGATYAEYGDETPGVIADAVENGWQPLLASTIVPSLLGGRRMSGNLPGPKGDFTAFNSPLQTARGLATANYFRQYPYGSDEGEVSPEDAEFYIRKAGEY